MPLGRPKGSKDTKPRRPHHAELHENIDRLIADAMERFQQQAREDELQKALEANPRRRSPDGGREARELAWPAVQQLIERGHTDEEIASYLGVELGTLTGGRGTRRPSQVRNGQVYRALKDRFQHRAKASLRHFLWSVYRGELQERDSETGAVVKIPVPFGYRFQAAMILARQTQYLGFDKEQPPVAVDPEAVPEDALVITVRDRSVLAPPKPIDVEVLKAITPPSRRAG